MGGYQWALTLRLYGTVDVDFDLKSQMENLMITASVKPCQGPSEIKTRNIIKEYTFLNLNR